jgi:hypothetical protein
LLGIAEPSGWAALCVAANPFNYRLCALWQKQYNEPVFANL